MNRLLLILIMIPLIFNFTNLYCQERIWSLEGGVKYQVILDGVIDIEDATIQVSMPKLSLSSVDMIVQHRDGKTRFTFKNFRTAGGASGIVGTAGNMAIGGSKNSNPSYDWYMIKKGKFRRWMEKYGKKDIANYLEKNIENLNDGWE